MAVTICRLDMASALQRAAAAAEFLVHCMSRISSRSGSDPSRDILSDRRLRLVRRLKHASGGRGALIWNHRYTLIIQFRHPEARAPHKRVYARLDALWGEPRRATASGRASTALGFTRDRNMMRKSATADLRWAAQRARPPQDDGALVRADRNVVYQNLGRPRAALCLSARRSVSEFDLQRTLTEPPLFIRSPHRRGPTGRAAR
jgi:hypothetical protein